jgi:hypothetical protein
LTLKPLDSWCRQLAGQSVDKYVLSKFLGAGKIGYVYLAQLRDLPNAPLRAIKLTFDLRHGWEEELRKVMALELVEGVVHFHDLGTTQIRQDGKTHLCQFTVWDYISPGRDLRSHLKESGFIDAGFMLAVIERVLHVLHACEAQGVVRHGDLHSGNILIGDRSRAKLDDSLQPRAPIYVADFGYGMTGGARQPKDDYNGLGQIINEMIARVEYSTATATHRQILRAMQSDFGKLLRENAGSERQSPLLLLQTLNTIKRRSQAMRPQGEAVSSLDPTAKVTSTIGQFQVSEMIGDRWDWWQRLFIPSLPARSRILALDIPTVVTGPRGCGKTMMFRRLSERLIVECGPIPEYAQHNQFVAFYVNANDFADAFAWFSEVPTREEQEQLICFANLCVLSDVLTVQSARTGRYNEPPADVLLEAVKQWLGISDEETLIAGQDRLEHFRAILEQIKWTFPTSNNTDKFTGYTQLGQFRWLPRFIQQIRSCCSWIGTRSILLFIDDFSTPRVTVSMQRTLNRLFLQRSSEFLAKIATEAWTTFIPEDSSGKNLQDGDDYQLIDLGEEALFLPDNERLAFLRAVFEKRLDADPRVSPEDASLAALLGNAGISKTEFARRLRAMGESKSEDSDITPASIKRGRARGRVLYHGEDVFANLWSGDTRSMIQLITDVIDQASDMRDSSKTLGTILATPVQPDVQDRAFRNRGGEWLNSHTRNEPTNPERVKREMLYLRKQEGAFSLQGTYGDHLKAIVEAFVAAANSLLFGPTYRFQEGSNVRVVPRMAFRLEIVDEFRLGGLAEEIYRDLIRYGLFMRDNRGKSVRGAFVPRLYLRRLLLPFATLPLSKRDSVQVSAREFNELLLRPDAFRLQFIARRRKDVVFSDNLAFSFVQQTSHDVDPNYEDLPFGIEHDNDGEPGGGRQ